MTLQGTWDKTSSADAVTKIFGETENTYQQSPSKQKRSAIPVFFDDWFNGDFTLSWPENLKDAIAKKPLEEYDQDYPKFRIHSAVEIGFNTSDNRTISDYEVRITDPVNDPNSTGGQAAITLEGGANEPGNPFRDELDSYDDNRDQHPQTLASDSYGPYIKHEKIHIEDSNQNTVEGIRGSIIYGGSDRYLGKAKKQGETLAELVALTPENFDLGIAGILSDFYIHIPPFYSFLDFVFMADGSKAARIWDASRYPAHGLYVDKIHQGNNKFRRGTDWVPQGPVLAHTAFRKYVQDSLIAQFTPFEKAATIGYKDGFWYGSGNHPVAKHGAGGGIFARDEILDKISDPLFPDEVEDPSLVVL